MRIGLVSVDGHNFPNFALMKLSAYHKSQGDSVEWADPLFGDYDRVYMSKIFTFTPDNTDIWDCEVVKGGTGYDIASKLPDEVDCLQPDYSIYPNIDTKTSYGFLTRGCPRSCKWCVVPLKEGKVKPYMDIDEITQNGKRPNVVLMDNNVLSSEYGLEQIGIAAKRGYRLDFNQGLDARLITEDIAKLLASCKWIRYIRVACDHEAQIPYIERALNMLESTDIRGNCFVIAL